MNDDTNLPGVVIALDEAEMAKRFAIMLSRRHQSRFRVNRCIIRRTRHRSGRRAIVEYELELVDTRGHFISVYWLTASIYSSKDASLLAKKVCRDVNDQNHIAFPFLPAEAITDLNILVQPFPFDRRLPGLTEMFTLTADSCCARDLVFALFGEHWSPIDVRTLVARYRAGLAAVLKYSIVAQNNRTSQREIRVAFAKVFRNTEAVRQNASSLRKLRNHVQAVGVVKPVCCVDSAAALVLAETPGRTLADVLLTESCDIIDAEVRRVAKALAKFNQEPTIFAREPSNSQHHESLVRSCKQLCKAAPGLTKRIERAMNLASQAETVAKGTVHGDLKLEHVFVSPGEIHLIDWDSYSSRDPVSDPAMLMVRIFAHGIEHGGSTANFQRTVDQFCAAYFSAVPPAWAKRLASQFAMAVIEVSHSYYRRRESCWFTLAKGLIDQAERMGTKSPVATA